MTERQGRDKFDYAITGIFICAILVSFNHTVDLYKSAGFNVPVAVLSNIMDYFFGLGDLFTLALFATIAAEAAFSVGLWGLYEAFKVERVFPSFSKYKSTWLVFFGGLLVIGWSNVGGSLGFNYLFGNPIKGYILGLSMPYFVLNSVMVNFSRTYKVEQKEAITDQPKWKQWIQTAKEIKSEVSTLVESNKQTEQRELPIEQTEKDQPSNSADPIPNEQSVQVQPNKKDRTHLQIVPNNIPTDQPIKQTKKDNRANKPNKQSRTNKTEQAVQYVIEQLRANNEFTTRQVAKIIGCSPSTAQTAISRAKQTSKIL